MASVGEMVRDVPGGRASLPSSVIQMRRFCRDFGVSLSSAPASLPDVPFITPNKLQKIIHFQSHLISIVILCVLFVSPANMGIEEIAQCLD